MRLDDTNTLTNLRMEHVALLRDRETLTRALAADLEPGSPGRMAKLVYEDGRFYVAVRADDMDEVIPLMNAVIERRLVALERRIAEFGVTDIHRDVPPPPPCHGGDDVSDEVPF